MEIPPASRKAPRLAPRLLLVALLAVLTGGGLYFQGWYTECRAGMPGGEACVIQQGIGVIFDFVAAMLVFLIGLVVVLIFHWSRKRRAARLV